MSKVVLQAKGIKRDFQNGETLLSILKGVDLTLHAGEVVALVGASGTGKSTLLQIIGLLDKPTQGSVHIDGVAVDFSDDKKRTALRSNALGFVYQAHHLMTDFTALENVMMPMLIAGYSKKEAREKAINLLGMVNLAERLDHAPSKLSGGERQRVALARAISNDPHILLADEPTGNLDEGTSDRVMEALLKTVRQTGLAAIIATHDSQVARKMDRVLMLSDGKLKTA